MKEENQQFTDSVQEYCWVVEHNTLIFRLANNNIITVKFGEDSFTIYKSYLLSVRELKEAINFVVWFVENKTTRRLDYIVEQYKRKAILYRILYKLHLRRDKTDSCALPYFAPNTGGV